MTTDEIGRSRGGVKAYEGTITATSGNRIAHIRIDCQDIDLAVAYGEGILARSPVKDAAKAARGAIEHNAPYEVTGWLLACLVQRKLGKMGLHELRAGGEVRFVFGPEEGRLRAFTASPKIVN